MQPDSFRKYFPVIIAAFLMSLFLLIFFVKYDHGTRVPQSATKLTKEHCIAKTKKMNVLDYAEVLGGLEKYPGAYTVDMKYGARLNLLKYTFCRTEQDADFYNDALAVVDRLGLTQERLEEQLATLKEIYIDEKTVFGKSENCENYLKLSKKLLCDYDSYQSCRARVDELSDNELVAELETVVAETNNGPEYLNCIDSAVSLAEKGPFSIEFVREFSDRICDPEKNLTPEECLEFIENSVLFQLAWGEYSEICPNKLHSLCSDELIKRLGSDYPCPRLCNLIDGAMNDDSLVENEITNLISSQNKDLRAKEIRKNASWIYRFRGIGEAENYCEDLNGWEKESCLVRTNVLKAKNLSQEPEKRCVDLRNQAENSFCLFQN